MKPKTDFKKQGKKNRAAGTRFETKVRKDLEKKNWIVCKWGNNIEFIDAPLQVGFDVVPNKIGKCVPAKRKYNPFSRALSIGVGFPDFFCYCGYDYGKAVVSQPSIGVKEAKCNYAIIFVECKSNGILDKIEKEKAQWYLDHNYCSKFLIACKGKKRGEIIYKDFNDYNK